GDSPKGPPPTVKIATVDENGRLLLTMTITEFQQVFKEIVVRVGEREEKRKVAEIVPVTVQKMIMLDGKDVEVYGTDGKRLDPKRLPKTRGPVPILVSSDGKQVDPFYLRLAREGTLIVVTPSLNQGIGIPVPVPVPPPFEKLPVEKLPPDKQ